MFHYKKICMVMLLLSYISLHAMNAILPEEAALEAVSNRIEEVLTGLKQYDVRVAGNYSISKPGAQFDWLPGYIVKVNADRIEGAEYLRPCIEQEPLSLLRLPKMKRFPVSKDKLSRAFAKMYIPRDLCLAEYIEGTHEGAINLLQAQHMVTLFRKAKKTLIDCGSRNIIFTAKGELALIDTDLKGFRDNDVPFALNQFYQNNKFHPDAKRYVESEMKKITG